MAESYKNYSFFLNRGCEVQEMNRDEVSAASLNELEWPAGQ